MIEKTQHETFSQILIEAGFDNGWVLQGDVLILWEHETDPPAPLTRPK